MVHLRSQSLPDAMLGVPADFPNPESWNKKQRTLKGQKNPHWTRAAKASVDEEREEKETRRARTRSRSKSVGPKTRSNSRVTFKEDVKKKAPAAPSKASKTKTETVCGPKEPIRIVSAQFSFVECKLVRKDMLRQKQFKALDTRVQQMELDHAAEIQGLKEEHATGIQRLEQDHAVRIRQLEVDILARFQQVETDHAAHNARIQQLEDDAKQPAPQGQSTLSETDVEEHLNFLATLQLAFY